MACGGLPTPRRRSRSDSSRWSRWPAAPPHSSRRSARCARGAHAIGAPEPARSLALLIVALGAQGWQLFDPGFSPYHAGAFGSVFVGFTATLFAHLLGATYWLETIVASSGAFHREREGVAQPSLLYEPAASAYGTFALFLAGVEVVAFVLIYIA